MRLGGIVRRFDFFREHERLLMICISTVLVMAGQGVISPILPLYAREFGVGAAAVGLTLTVFALARLLLNVPLGLLSDRYGRRLLLVGGPVVTAVGMIGSGLAPTFAQLLLWRFVAGAGSGMYMTGAMIYITDISTPENRARFIGTNQGALLLGVSIGPGVGGLLAEVFGLRAPFYVVGGAALIAAAYSYLRLPETRSRAAPTPIPEADPADIGPPSGARERPWLRMIRSRDFAALSFVTMMIFFTRSAGRQTIVPLLADARLGMSPAVLGGIFTASSVINLLLITPAAFAADRFGRKAVIVPGGALLSAGLLIYAGAGTYSAFLIATAVLAMGLYRTSGDFGFVVGPPLLGLIADHNSFGWALGVNAVLVALSVLVFAALARETAGRASTAARRIEAVDL